MRTCLLMLLLLTCYKAYSQEEGLNALDEKGKKHGVWQVYLDSLVNPVEEKDSAFFILYEAYDHGRHIFKRYANYNADADSMAYDSNWPVKGQPRLIHGTFEWFTSDGRILQHEEYSEGKPKYWKSYQYYAKDIHTCGFNEIFDWTKQYNGIEGSYYYEEIWRGNEVGVRGWHRPGKRGWKLYKIKD